MSPLKRLRAGTRVRTPYGIGTVTYPNAVPVRLDVPIRRASAETVLVSPTKIEVIESRAGGAS